LVTISSPDHPKFDLAFRLLDDYFGGLGEMETRDIIAKRLSIRPEHPINGYHMLYQIMMLYRGEECVGLRDHTAILGKDSDEVVVHLSHVLVLPKWRRKGLSAILRTLPANTAHECARRVSKLDLSVTLLCEMEPLDLSIPANKIRRISYEKAGYKALGSTLNYSQPDFRKPSIIDADPEGQKPIPLDVLLLRLGRNKSDSISAEDARSYIEQIYTVYTHSFRKEEMLPCLNWFNAFTQKDVTNYPLYKPTEAP